MPTRLMSLLAVVTVVAAFYTRTPAFHTAITAADRSPRVGASAATFAPAIHEAACTQGEIREPRVHFNNTAADRCGVATIMAAAARGIDRELYRAHRQLY